MTKHDYKRALNYIADVGLEVQDDGVFNTIRHALLLADKVTGEPSGTMVGEGAFNNNGLNGVSSIFKAMIQQAEREIG